MHIKRLYLGNFGKFHSKELELDSSFNIIHGANESGKSTVHKFIEGMLFGFFKRYAKKRIYSEDHMRYQPWRGLMYDGAMVYCHHDREYRIERNFLKGRDSVKIFDNSSGRDMTRSALYNAVLGLPEPATVHFGISQAVYTNTLSIGQLKLKTDEDLAGEVREIFINSESGGSEEISVIKALAALRERISGIGTVKAKSTLLGGICARIGELEKELEESRSSYESVIIMQKDIENLKKSRKEAEMEIGRLEDDLLILKNEAYKKRYERCLKAKEQAGMFLSGAEKFRDYAETDDRHLETVISCAGEIRNIAAILEGKKAKMQDLKNKASDISEKLKKHSVFEIIGKAAVENLRTDHEVCGEMKERMEELKKRILKSRSELEKLDGVCDTLNEDYSRFTELEKERRELERPPEMLQSLRERYERLRREKKSRTMLLILFALLSAAGLVAGFLTLPPAYLAAVPVALLTIAAGIARHKSAGRLKETCGMLEAKEASYAETVRCAEEEAGKILEKNGAENRDELVSKHIAFGSLLERKPELENEMRVLSDQASNMEVRITEAEKRMLFITQSVLDRDIEIVTDARIDEVLDGYGEYRDTRTESAYNGQDIKALAEEIAAAETELEAKGNAVAEILASNGAESIEGYIKAVEYKRTYLEYTGKYDEKMQMLEQLLEGLTIESLRERIDGSLRPWTSAGEGSEETETKLGEAKRRAADLETEAARQEERKMGIEKSSRPAVDIITELECLNGQKESAENRIRAFEAAIGAIERAAARIRESFAPGLNKKISAVMSAASSGRYDEIMMDQDMNIGIFDKEHGRTIQISDLSVGTIDQVYFAIRFSLLELIKQDETLPFFLDDPFVNYDRQRTVNILRLIHSESAAKNRQVALFTCHEREMEILEDEGLSFKYIELS